MKKQKFVPDEQFWEDNGIKFPKVIIYPSGRISWKNYNTAEDFQKFIDYFGYWSSTELNKELGSFYQRLIRLGLEKKIKYLTINTRQDLTMYNTLEDFQKFVDSKDDINTHRDFSLKYSGVYGRASRLGLIRFIKFNKMEQRWSHIKTEDEAREIINELNILYRGDCMNRYPGLAGHLSKVNLIDIVLPKLPCNDYSQIRSEEDIKEFIKDNNILNSSDLSNRFPGLRRAIERLGYRVKNFSFPKSRKSILEIMTEKFLTENNINFNHEEVFSETGLLRYDFWLPEYNLVLEPGGEQHFISVPWFGGDNYLKLIRDHDKRKRDFCRSNGLTLIYWFKFGAQSEEAAMKALNEEKDLGEYYLDFDKFTNRILEITGQNKNKGD